MNRTTLLHTLSADSDGSAPDELLDFYLHMPQRQRAQRFADTARTAEIAGMSQRTIQLWVEIGILRAVRIGRKYKVDLISLKSYLQESADAASLRSA